MPSEKEQAIHRFKPHEETEEDLILLRKLRVCWILDKSGKHREVPPEVTEPNANPEVGKGKVPKVWTHS